MNVDIKKIKTVALSAFRSLGRSPNVDWLFICICMCLCFIAGIIFGTYRFVHVKGVIERQSDILQVDSTTLNKTKEEELRDVLKIYQDKESAHQVLVPKIKKEAEANEAQEKARLNASSTATSTNILRDKSFDSNTEN